MPGSRIAPYGSWKSPVTSDLIVAGTIGLGEIALDGRDIYWVEMRPTEGGRNVVVRRTPDGRAADVTPPGFNVRTRVHEYGGGAFLVDGGTVYFSNFADQRLYRQAPGASPQALTPQGAWRYADGVMDRRRGLMIWVREDHTDATREAVNTLVGVDPAHPGEGRVLVSGNDFYSDPRLSPDGASLAWLTWRHPNMPWDGTELWVAPVRDGGTLGEARRVAGGEDESIFQPAWSPDNVLHFVSDRTGWWNLYRWRGGRIEPLAEQEAEFGAPQWMFRTATYAFESAGRIVCVPKAGGLRRLGVLDEETRRLEIHEPPYSEVSSPQAGPGFVVMVAGSPTEAPAIVRVDLRGRGRDVLRRSSQVAIDPGYLSVPQAVEFPTEDGHTAHGFFYPPRNRDFAAPAGEKPPLLVVSHGGPTGAASATFSPGFQYWTSRGFALLDVNYGGSTGYGRRYRERLNGRWGVVDVDDCVNGARDLVRRGLVDGARLVIRGGSAGGYTTLCAVTFRSAFAAGASHFGIGDLEVFVRDTHKFESRYLDRLVGPYPQMRDRYRERSPIHYVDRIRCPMLLFQGLDDKIVPPNQAELMVAALRQKGLPVAYIAFEGEQHGFRKAENIKRTLDAELYFYSRVFRFPLADPVDPVPIENL
ncbi:MAG: S9 family peptidase [Bacillati bacterium ANGP1]|uniref:S9 family peptidase n=1 Tax=Candidatus Segetimicrobium genomatis TaxID=2569760 RepID=A0A537K572_9BACT|nr:MAG: S9 family peptidase [Terrabacteria group bacterium ANGP1]